MGLLCTVCMWIPEGHLRETLPVALKFVGKFYTEQWKYDFRIQPDRSLFTGGKMGKEMNSIKDNIDSRN